jgi:DNA-binding NtrC family response regulator
VLDGRLRGEKESRLEYQEHSAISVLVAENTASARSSLADLLRYEGYRVFEAQDGDEAVACIEANLGLSVLLVDLYLPECASIIQHAQLKLPQVFVVGMGAWDSAPAPSISATLDLWLSKPLVFDGVRTAIHDYLAGSKLDHTEHGH